MNMEEFPFIGTISRTTLLETGDVVESVIYDGIMDATISAGISGDVAQTSDYVVSIPIDMNGSANPALPKKNDTVRVSMYGDNIVLKVTNSMPSILDCVTIYATRGAWK